MTHSKDLAVAARFDATLLPDNAQYTHRMAIRSESSDREYVVAQRKANGQWSCGCPGFLRFRRCKHASLMFPPLLETYGGSPARLGPAPAVVRPEPKSPAARAAKAARDRKTWKGEGGRHYDPAVSGFGSPEQWAATADAAASGRGVRKTAVGRMADLVWLGLAALPASVAGLKKAFRAAAKVHHPDAGGSAKDFKAMYAAYVRLLKNY